MSSILYNFINQFYIFDVHIKYLQSNNDTIGNGVFQWVENSVFMSLTMKLNCQGIRRLHKNMEERFVVIFVVGNSG